MHLSNDDILLITDGVWDGPKRVRHKMPQAWVAEGNRILWIEGAPFPKDWAGERIARSVRGDLREVEPGIWVGSPPPALPFMHKGTAFGNALRAAHRPWMLRRIRRYMAALEFQPRYVVLMQLAARWDLLSAFPDAMTIFYCHDIYGYGFATDAMVRDERVCCARVDVAFATSEVLTKRLADFGVRAVSVPHAVSPAWWESNRDRVPPEYASIPGPRAVYTGVVQEKIDFALLCAVAERLPAWQFVLVGPVEEHAVMRAGLAMARALPNVHFLGPRDVDDLPGYLAGADALMLPYLRDDNMKMAGLALKFYEYFITGKPVLATPYTDFDVSPENLFDVAPDAEGWVERLTAMGAGAIDEASAERRVALAMDNTYGARVALQRESLDGKSSFLL